MTDTGSQGAPEVVKDLAEAFSAQSKLSNRLWAALFAIAVVAVLPTSPSSGTLRDLPFGLGSANSNIYDLIVFGMLTILTIAFCQAQAEASRAYRLAQITIDNLQCNKDGARVDPRHFLDLLSIPTLVRTSPLPLLFQEQKEGLPIRDYTAAAYYLLLKFVALVIVFGLPGFALWSSYARLLGHSPSLSILVPISIFGLLAGIVVIHVLWVETRVAIRVAHLMKSRQLTLIGKT